MMTTEEPTLTRRERREIEEAQQTVVATPEFTTDKTEPAVEPTQRKKPNLMPATPPATDMGKDTGALPVLALDDDEDYFTPSRPVYVEASELSASELAGLLAEQEREDRLYQEALDREAERLRMERQQEPEPQPAQEQQKPVPVSLKIFTIASFAVSGLSAAAYILTTLGIF